jgi:hypothetical protein
MPPGGGASAALPSVAQPNRPRSRSHGLQLSDALELDPELVALRRRELLELAEPALERRDCGRAVLTGVAQRV